jgi:hypothetical protein
MLSRRQLAIGAPLIGALLAGVQYFDTHIWQAVVLAFIGAPFIGAYVIVLAPYLLQLLPRSGGLGERLGLLLSPFNLVGVVLAYVAAAVVDATGNYRLIWVFPAATGIAHALVNTRLRFPVHRPRTDMVTKLWDWSVLQSESMAETGIVAGLLAAPLLGEVTKEDADSAVIVDVARDILGDPYADDATADDGTADDVTKDDPASDKTSLDKSAPDSTTPDSTTPDSTTPDSTALDSTALDKTTPDSTASDDVPEPASKPGDERPTPPGGTGTIASAGQSGGASKAPSGRTDDA